MKNLNILASEFETKLIKNADNGDAIKIAQIFGSYELMTEPVDALLEGLDLMVAGLEKDGIGEALHIIKQQKELLEGAIAGVYGQIAALDAKIQELSAG